MNEYGQMAVVDKRNNRVLVWDSIPTDNSVAAHQVIGQATSDSGSQGTSVQKMFRPSGVRFHNRNLIVTDSGNNRVLVWRATN